MYLHLNYHGPHCLARLDYTPNIISNDRYNDITHITLNESDIIPDGLFLPNLKSIFSHQNHHEFIIKHKFIRYLALTINNVYPDLYFLMELNLERCSFIGILPDKLVIPIFIKNQDYTYKCKSSCTIYNKCEYIMPWYKNYDGLPLVAINVMYQIIDLSNQYVNITITKCPDSHFE